MNEWLKQTGEKGIRRGERNIRRLELIELGYDEELIKAKLDEDFQDLMEDDVDDEPIKDELLDEKEIDAQ